MPTRRRAAVVALSILLPGAALLAAFALAEGAWRAAGAVRCRLERKPYAPAFELYGVGESTMTGQPYTVRLSPAQAVPRLFHGTLDGRPITTILLARRGERLFHQALRLDEALRCRDERNPGAVLLYTGNNDDGFPAEPSLSQRAVQAVLYRSRLLTQAVFFLQEKAPALRINNLEWWRFHLRHVLAAARASGLKTVIATVPVNLADVDPGIHSREATAAQARELVETAAALEARGGCAAALPYFDRELQRRPALEAYLRYEGGRCALALGRREEARRRLARSLATRHIDNFGRATRWQNEDIRALGSSGAASVSDAEALFAAKARRGVPGDDLFADGHHPNADGYALLADAYAARLAGLFGAPVPRGYGGGEALLRSADDPEAEREHGLRVSGYWFMLAAVDHHYPRRRLEAAARRLERACAMEPDGFSEALGAAVARAALSGDRMAEPEALAFLNRYGLYFQPKNAFSDADWALIRARLRDWGAPPAMLERAERNRAHAPRATLGS